MVELAWRDSLVLQYEIPEWDGDFGRVTSYVRITPGVRAAKGALLHECFPSQEAGTGGTTRPFSASCGYAAWNAYNQDA